MVLAREILFLKMSLSVIYLFSRHLSLEKVNIISFNKNKMPVFDVDFFMRCLIAIFFKPWYLYQMPAYIFISLKNELIWEHFEINPVWFEDLSIV